MSVRVEGLDGRIVEIRGEATEEEVAAILAAIASIATTEIAAERGQEPISRWQRAARRESIGLPGIAALPRPGWNS